jgi:APA family basic amino acid/polyamine antiporter
MENAKAVVIDQSKIPLRRVLGLTTGILIVASTIVGSGVFKKIAPMSAVLMNKNYILLVWALAGIISIFGAFTMAGMATMTDESGGIYEYLRLSFGNLFSFLYGWASFLVIGSAGNAAVAYIFSQSVNSIIRLHDPLQKWQHISIGHFVFPFESSGIKILAIGTIVLLTWINILGAKKGGYLNNIVAGAKITGILLLIIMGLSYHGLPEHESLVQSVFNRSLFSAIIVAMLSAFWAYDGWYCIGFISGEIKNPQRNIPLSIISGIGISMVLYLLLNYAFMNVMPVDSLAKIGENDIAGLEVARILSSNVGAMFISVLIAISTFGTLNATIIAYPRLYYRMAQEKFFPKKMTFVHPRYRTPYVALIYSGVWSSVMVLSGTFDILTDMLILVEFLFFALLGWGLIKMKRQGKITAKLIAYPLSPVILIVFSLGLIINTCIELPVQSIAGILLTLSGIPVYYYYKKKNNKPDLVQNESEAHRDLGL